MNHKSLISASFVFVMMLFGNSLNAQVYITEFMASNASAYIDPEKGTFSDWIELYNPDEQEADISGYFLSDDQDDPLKWAIPLNTVIPPGGYLIIFADKTGQGLRTSFGLAREGEDLVLSNSIGIPRDIFSYGEQLPDVSMGRDPDDEHQWVYYGHPTPGEPNGIEGLDRPISLPSFDLSVPAGFYPGSFSVIHSVPADFPGVIHYTLDGSIPKESDPILPEELFITQSSVLKAKAFAPGHLPGPMITRSYFIGEEPILPVFSISINPEYLWDDDIGIHVDGSGFNGDRESRNSCIPDWERPMHIEFFEPNGKLVFTEDAGIQVKGRMNCEFPRKPLGIYFRTRYGVDEIDYPFFPEKQVTKFSSFFLRPGGADGIGDCYNGTMFRDGLLSTLLVGQMDIDYEGYRPAVLFVNGEYWGINNIRERNKKDYLAGNHGIDPENIDLLENPSNGGIIEGDDVHYKELLRLVSENDVLDDHEMERVKEMIDLREFLNYQIAEIFVNNEDWAHNNVLCWRPRTSDGKWRWVFFDVEGGFGLYDADDYLHNMLGFKDDPYLKHARLFRKLITNQTVSDDFVQGFAAHLNSTFSTDRVLAILDSLYNDIVNEMPRDIDRWSGQTTLGGAGCSCLASLDEWNAHVEIMREFARQRPAVIRQQIMNRFHLDGMIDLDLESVGGSISVNGVKNAADGLYFSNVPLRLVAVPNPGYQFVGWQGFAGDQNIELVLDQDTTITAVFERDGTSILPPEINGTVVLTADASPYVGTGDIIVNAGASLHMEPGSLIRMSPASSIYVYGLLKIDGKQDHPIKITSLHDKSDRWGALVFHEAEEGSFIHQLHIEQASVGGLNPSLFKANLNIIETQVPIVGLYINDALTNPLFIKGNVVSVQFADLFSVGVGDYINVAEAEQVLIDHCYFRGNEASDTDAIDLDAVGKTVVSNCRFEKFVGSNSDGIDVGFSHDVMISNNEFSRISDKGISVGMGSKVVAFRNIFSFCNAGSGVKDDGSILLADRNTYYMNSIGIHCFEKEPGRGGGRAEVVNSLFAGPSQIPGLADDYSDISYRYSWYEEGELEGDNNFSGDSKIKAPSAGIMLLDRNSPCRDAGDPGTTDDPDGTQPDIGALFFHKDQLNELFINEMVISDSEAWVELYNAGSIEVSSDDLLLFADPLNRNGISFAEPGPSNSSILPGQFKFYDISSQIGQFLKDSELSVELYQNLDDQLHMIAKISSEVIPDDASFGSYPDGSYSFQYFSTPTPGAPNQPDGSKRGQLFINEFLTLNDNGIEDQSGDKEDWIEIYNGGNTGVNLAGLFLTDDLDNPTKWRIPDDDLMATYLPAGGFMIFWADGDTVTTLNHVNFKLSSGGEEIGLFEIFENNLLSIDTLVFGPQEPDISFGRYPDGSDLWRAFDNPTPDESNIILSIDNEVFQRKFIVYPNPASDVVHVKIPGNVDHDLAIELVDLTGHALLHFPVDKLSQESTISLMHLSPGLYFVRLLSRQNVRTQRLIIQ